LWCWGLDQYGQLGVDLGDGEHAAYIASSTPTQVLGSSGSPPLPPWRSISLGGFHSAGILENGSLYTWGLNGHGQLGLSDSNLPANRDSPSEVIIQAVGVNWQQISAGKRHSCGVDASNRLWCWGDCEDGRVGNSRSSGITTTPSRIGDTSIDWASVSAGGNSSCAIKTNGTLACWGNNEFGQLGIGSSGPSPQCLISFERTTVCFSHRNRTIAITNLGGDRLVAASISELAVEIAAPTKYPAIHFARATEVV
ncbi:MAG TPA: hypothetical protein EYN66_09060, partial [Myxococcales bacterium]|nr:hypothetical protein [Myxococcales bacterium]